MKKILSMILLTVLILSFGTVFAEQTVIEQRKAAWLSPNQYFYSQLSDEHKAAFEFDIANVLTYPEQTAAANQDRRMQALASMIKTENPKIFWIDWIDSNGRLRFETGSTATYADLIIPDGLTLADHQKTFLYAIRDAAGEIRARLSADAGTYEKAKVIHDWLCENSSYNYAQTSSHKQESDPVSFDYLAAHSAYSAIIPGDEYQPVCEGYACAFRLLCDEIGVPCLSVNGSTAFASRHMWNIVRLEDGKWYLVDVTSDDVEAYGIDYYHSYFMLDKAGAAKQAYTPNEYMNSGINPTNNYTEGAAFVVPGLAE